MSSIVNKVKDALHSDKDKPTHHEGTHSSTNPTTTTAGTHGTHGTHGTSANDPRLHNPTTTGGALGGTTGTHNTALGGSDNYTSGVGANRGATGPASRTDGPHNSDMLNKADPRVDSDRDHSRNLGMNPQGSATTGTTTGTGIGGAHHHSGITGTTSLGGDRTAGTYTRTDGPHDSNLANKADPRVDSDRDHSRNMGANPHGTATTGTSGTGGIHGTHTGTAGTGDNAAFFGGPADATGINRGGDGPATRTDGPHGSNLANKVDPRIDSDRDHSRNLGANPHGTATAGTTIGTGTHGTHATHGTTGTHDTHGTHGTHAGTTGMGGVTGTTAGTHGIHNTAGSGPGPAPNTAGPYKSDLMNKADPRVDSDLDGSKTIGGNKTTESRGYKDPTDAAQVPPSVLQKHIGDPTVEHGDASHERGKRHSSRQPLPKLVNPHHASIVMATSISQALWDARIPLCITHTSSPTNPFITSVPRFSYLALLLPRLSAFFGSTCSSFHFEDVQLRNLAVGLLVDLYQPTLPFRLVVSDGVGWDIGDTFLNCVKEADFVRNGNANQIMKMSKEHTTQLWNAVIDNDHGAFARVNTRLLNAPTNLKHVPMRIYIPSAPEQQDPAVALDAGSFRIIQPLVPPMSANRKPKLLGQALKELMPKLFPSSRDPVLAGAVMHGAGVPFDAPLGELMREAAYPDGWLCLVVTV
ncbi:ATG5 protein [Metarhizium rileyi]|uniref:Autophagy protein 5 n=1 Tax=Metarhizium rileyi (strain RCEF 4871) TaxID=1649241 RepID=A0A162JHG1_METRR|nr:ATG5 protein [Metarhizium rileyi RCEF 4871]